MSGILRLGSNFRNPIPFLRRVSAQHWPGLALVVAAAGVWGWLFVTTFRTLSSPDQLDYAQIGRRLLRGQGFTTDVIWPLNLVRFPTLVNHPEFHRAPGFSVLVAGAEAIWGQNDRAVASVSGLAYILSVGLVYFFAWRLFHSRRVATLAAALLLVNQEMVVNSQTGLADLTFAFYLTLLLYMMWRKSSPAAMGMALGAGYLLRYNLLVMLPGFLLFWQLQRPLHWRRYILTVLGSMFLVIAPWLLRNQRLAGAPFFTMPSYLYVMGTATYPGQELFRQVQSVNIGEFLLTNPVEVLEKVIGSARYLYNELPEVTNFFVVALFAVSAFSPLGKDRRARTLQYGVLTMAGFQLLAVLPLEHEKIRLFFPFVPFMTIYAAQLLDTLLDLQRIQDRGRIAVMAAAVVLVAVPTLPEFGGASYRWDFVQAPAELRQTEVMEDPQALIITDAPHAVAWYLDRTAVQMPKTFEDFERVVEFDEELNYVFLFYTDDKDRYQRQSEYQREYIANVDFRTNYELVRSFSSGSMLFRLRP